MDRGASMWPRPASSVRIVLVLAAFAAADVGAGDPVYLGAGACAARTCHGSDSPRDASRLSRQDEYRIWSGERRAKESYGEDRHRKAYEVLLTESGAGIARRLGMIDSTADARSWIRDAADPRRCLACHGLDDGAAAPRSVIVASDGVTCEACHGAAGGWGARHFQRGWRHQDSVRAGMVDTRDPVIGAEPCLGCHLGSATQRVDHRMLAAGHPPLVFELDTFATFSPHWRKHEENAAWYDGTPWVVGQVLALRAAAALAARQVRSDGWPDFAAYDCYTCHHRLTRSARPLPRRLDRGVPGLPPWNPSRYLVLSRVAHVLAGAQARGLDAAVSRLATLVRDGQGGAATALAADRVAEASDRVLEDVRRTPLDADVIGTLLRTLSAAGPELASGGFHTAQQVGWSLDSLATARTAIGPMPGDEALALAIRRLLDQLDEPSAYDPDRFRRDLRSIARDVP